MVKSKGVIVFRVNTANKGLPSVHMTLMQRQCNADAMSRRCIDVDATLSQLTLRLQLWRYIFSRDTIAVVELEFYGPVDTIKAMSS